MNKTATQMVEKIVKLFKLIDEENQKNVDDFLDLFKTLATSIPPGLYHKIEQVNVAVKDSSNNKCNWQINFSNTDYYWWKNRIRNGAVIQDNINDIKSDMMENVFSFLENSNLNDENRLVLEEALKLSDEILSKK